MQNDKISAKLEKYPPGVKINRKLGGPVFIISFIYILAYLVITFYLWSIEFQMTNIQQTLYFVGFGLFVITIYLAFTGVLLRSIK
jgi:hypothetical protein